MEEHVPLASLTTFKTGGAAAHVARIRTEADLVEALSFARARGLSFYTLGQGSNVVPPDEGYEGVVALMEIPDIEWTDAGDTMRVAAGAGVAWDDLVREAAERGLWGLENLAGIPGTVGAAPVQNIGAYGAELSQVLVEVEAYDAATGESKRMSAADCALGYRDSRFKRERNLVITRATFSLSKSGEPRIEYGDLLKAREQGADLSTPVAIGAAVRQIRAGKFPDLREFGTAGSFFKNPVLSKDAYDALVLKYGPVPQFPNPNGIKIPLAFILDKALSLRGFRLGDAWLFGAQPLVLVLDKGGASASVEALAREIEKRVYDATGIRIEREVRTMPEK